MGHRLIQRRLAHRQVLKILGSRVGRLHQREGPAVIRFGGFEERNQAVHAEIGIDRDGIGLQRRALGEIGRGIGFGRRADIAALDVQDDDHPVRPCALHAIVQNLDAAPSHLLEESRLGLDCRDASGDPVHDGGEEGADGGGRLKGIRRHVADAENLRNQMQMRINAHAERVTALSDSRYQTVAKVHSVMILDACAGQEAPTEYKSSSPSVRRKVSILGQFEGVDRPPFGLGWSARAFFALTLRWLCGRRGFRREKILVKHLGLSGWTTPCAGRQHLHDPHRGALMEGNDVAGPYSLARFRRHHAIDPHLIVLTLLGGEGPAFEETGEPQPFVKTLGSGRGDGLYVRHREL